MTALPGLRPDPPVRADGRCVVCMKPRKPERSAKYVPGEAERDPFCSNPCARKWHDNDLRPDSIWSLEPVEKEVA